jgi:hypothetical protein
MGVAISRREELCAPGRDVRASPPLACPGLIHLGLIPSSPGVFMIFSAAKLRRLLALAGTPATRPYPRLGTLALISLVARLLLITR